MIPAALFTVRAFMVLLTKAFKGIVCKVVPAKTISEDAAVASICALFEKINSFVSVICFPFATNLNVD